MDILGFLLIVMIFSAFFDGGGVVLHAFQTPTDPQSMPILFGATAAIVCLCLYRLTWRGIWASLLDSLRFVGLLSLIASPLLWLATDNWRAGVAMALSGSITLGVISTLFRHELQAPVLEEGPDDEEDEAA